MPPVDVIAAVAPFGGAAMVTSPVSGARGLVVHLEVREGERSLGAIVLGDTIELRADDGARYVVVARRAVFGFTSAAHATPLEVVPPELVALLARSRGRDLSVVEHVIRPGDRVRLRAHVDAGRVRDDERPVRLDEVI